MTLNGLTYPNYPEDTNASMAGWITSAAMARTHGRAAQSRP